MSKRYTVTAALPYANGPLHLGHLAGAYLPADIYARTQRSLGNDVAFVCGSDEHGAAITIKSKKEGVTPKQIIDTYHEINKDTFEKLGISFDIYHRTSAQDHHEMAQDFFKHLYQLGDQFEEKISNQFYDASFKQFLADRYIIGTCPKCGHDEAYGDQCEKCGSALSPNELIDPRSTLSGDKPVMKETKHWYFRLDQHSDWLKKWIEDGNVNEEQLHDPSSWRKHVKGQCLSWIDNGLQPRAITRDLDWGIKVPLDDADGKVLYVWFDAPIGYISATKKWADQQGKDWKDYWQNKETELIHFIGKDNIVFHCIVFPAMLKAHGDYILPKHVPANQFLNLEGQKFSKSKGWVIEQHQYLKDLSTFQNNEDALRFALIRTMPENKDGDFKWDEFIALHDNELVANYGNFVHRVLSLMQAYYQGQIPNFNTEQPFFDPKGDGEISMKAYLQLLEENASQIIDKIQAFEFKQAIQLFLDLASMGNSFLQKNEPWKLKKDPEQVSRIAAIMVAAVQTTAVLSVVASPFLPFSSKSLLGMLQLDPSKATMKQLLHLLGDSSLILKPGHQLNAPSLLFAKINDKKDTSRSKLIEAQKEKLTAMVAGKQSTNNETIVSSKSNEKLQKSSNTGEKGYIDFSDFLRVEVKVGTIQSAVKVPKADKLLQLEVDLGFESRTIISGIAEHYHPDEVIEKQVLVVTNLAPRKMRGVVSEGMILMAEDASGKLVFVSPDNPVTNGVRIK